MRVWTRLEVIRVLERAGFELRRGGRGNHDIYVRAGRPPVPVPRHRGDLAKGTVRSIWRLAGLTQAEAEALLSE